jgi:hypothetical protein
MRIFHLGLMVAPPPNDSARKAFIANCDRLYRINQQVTKDVNTKKLVRIARAVYAGYNIHADSST